MTPLLIRGARVLRGDLKTCDPADMWVEAGVIRAIEPSGRITREDVEVVDATDRLLVPGLVNGHTHSHGGLGKGAVGDRIPLEILLTTAPGVSGNRTLDDKRLSATLSAVEGVRKGSTAAYDLCVEFPAPSRDGIDAVAEAYAEVGMRAVIAPMMADRTLYDALPGLMQSLSGELQERVRVIKMAPYETSVATAREILQGWGHDRAKIRPALGPTIPLHCSDEFLVACGRLSEEFDVGLQTHLAESKTQAVLGYTKYGKSLTAHLQTLGLLNPRFSAAHGIWLDDDDIARMAAAGASVSHNPMSNLRLGSGVAPARAYLTAGVRLGIGTDGTNSADGQNMFEALRLASYLSRIGDADYEQWLSVEEVFRAATRRQRRHSGFRAPGSPRCWILRRHRFSRHRSHQLRTAAQSVAADGFYGERRGCRQRPDRRPLRAAARADGDDRRSEAAPSGRSRGRASRRGQRGRTAHRRLGPRPCRPLLRRARTRPLPHPPPPAGLICCFISE